MKYWILTSKTGTKSFGNGGVVPEGAVVVSEADYAAALAAASQASPEPAAKSGAGE